MFDWIPEGHECHVPIHLSPFGCASAGQTQVDQSAVVMWARSDPDLRIWGAAPRAFSGGGGGWGGWQIRRIVKELAERLVCARKKRNSKKLGLREEKMKQNQRNTVGNCNGQAFGHGRQGMRRREQADLVYAPLSPTPKVRRNSERYGSKPGHTPPPTATNPTH